MFESRRRANIIVGRNRKLAVALAVLAVILLAFGAVDIRAIALWPFSILLFIGAVVLLFTGGGTWGVGAEGEERVEKTLTALADPYRVIHDVFLPGRGGNIDHVVAGPNGVFAVETKNHNGYISCNGDQWLQTKVGQRGTQYFGKIGNPSRQVKSKAASLSEFLRSRLGLSIYINGVVVFANDEARLSIHNATVAILRPNDLVLFLREYASSRVFDEREIEQVSQALEPYSHHHAR